MILFKSEIFKKKKYRIINVKKLMFTVNFNSNE